MPSTSTGLNYVYLAPNESNPTRQNSVTRQLLEAISGYSTFFATDYLQVETTGSAPPINVEGGVIPNAVQIANGTDASAPGAATTSSGPSVAIGRYETLTNIDTGGGNNAALYVRSKATNVSSVQVTCTTAYSEQRGAGDACCFLGISDQWTTSTGSSATGTYSAFGAFLEAVAHTSNSNAIALQTGVINNTGISTFTFSNYSANFIANGNIFGAMVGIDLATNGGGPATAGIALRAAGGVWDVGYGALKGSVGSYFARDDSTSDTVIHSSANHNRGIDFTGATFGQFSIVAPSFTVDPSGNEKSNTIQNTGVNFSGLPTASSTNGGLRAMLTNFSSNATWGTSVTTGNVATSVPVYCDGAVWRFG